MNRMFDDFFGDFGTPLARVTGATFMPRIDVEEKETEYILTAELAGVDQKDVDISVADGVLTIKGQKKDEREERDSRCFVTERSYGSFTRSINLGDAVDADKIDAAYKNGVLTVKLPKVPDRLSNPRRSRLKRRKHERLDNDAVCGVDG
jgi:HSP20 family protein